MAQPECRVVSVTPRLHHGAAATYLKAIQRAEALLARAMPHAALLALLDASRASDAPVGAALRGLEREVVACTPDPSVERLRDIAIRMQAQQPGEAPARGDASDGPPVAVLRGVCKSFGDSAGEFALDVSALELRLSPGSILAVTGANASGKTTLLKIAAGRLRATKGTRTGDDRLAVAFVDNPPTLPGCTVQEYLELCAEDAGGPSTERVANAPYFGSRLAVAKHSKARIGTLSSGTRVRVALAGALLRRPSLIVLDEPLAPLDFVRQREFLVMLLEVVRHSARSTAVVFSSHHIEIVERIADCLLVLSDGRAEIHDRRDRGADSARSVFEIQYAYPDVPLQVTAERFPDADVVDIGVGTHIVRARSKRTLDSLLLNADSSRIVGVSDLSDSVRRRLVK